MTKRQLLCAGALFGGALPVMALFAVFPGIQLDVAFSPSVRGNLLFLSAALPAIFVLLNTGRPLVRPRSYVVDGVVLGYSVSIFIRLVVATFARDELTVAFARWSYTLPPAAAHTWRVANAAGIVALLVFGAIRMVNRQLAAQASQG